MAYCRFGEGDVYLMGTHIGGEEGFYCCGCLLNPKKWVENDGAQFGGYLEPIDGTPDFTSLSRIATLAHLGKHIVAGHIVPGRAIENLTTETEWGQP